MSKLQLMNRKRHFNTWECRQIDLYKCNSNLRNLHPKGQLKRIAVLPKIGAMMKPYETSCPLPLSLSKADSAVSDRSLRSLTAFELVLGSIRIQSPKYMLFQFASMILILIVEFGELKQKTVSWAKNPNPRTDKQGKVVSLDSSS